VKKNTLFVGLDVRADTISVAIAESGRDGQVYSMGTIANRPDSIRKLIRKLKEKGEIRVCYEAGPCGYVIYWQLVELGVRCDVVVPTLIARKPGDKVKTDRRDATKLAQLYRAGELTPMPMSLWTQKHMRWVKSLSLEQPVQEVVFRGIRPIEHVIDGSKSGDRRGTRGVTSGFQAFYLGERVL
jgi:transposase